MNGRLSLRAASLLVMALLLTSQAMVASYAEQLSIAQGSVLYYEGARASETWDVQTNVLRLDASTMVFQTSFDVNGTSGGSNVTIDYRNGFPVDADYITSIIYLPPGAIQESVDGNASWASLVTSKTLATVTPLSAEVINYTVKAGTFRSVEIDLALQGMDFGNLTLIYDIASGILLFEQWVPADGDMQGLLLETVSSPALPSLSILSIAIPAVLLATPVVTTLGQAGRRVRRGPAGPPATVAPGLKSGFPRRPFYVGVAGALLSLLSAFAPWSSIGPFPAYLPYSLLAPFSGTGQLSLGTFYLAAALAYSAALLAWVGVAGYVYAGRRLLPQLASAASAVLAFASAWAFLQSGWTPSYGLQAAVLGGAVILASLAWANVRVELVPEEGEPPTTG
ncbi:MAG: hypothetical protein ABSG92_05525 [Conexivisphaerales archaeon]